jgi:multidrug transporter EmrE-like cation transporter
MRSKKIINAAKNSIYNMAMLIFSIMAAFWDFAVWLKGSELSLWLGIGMLIIAGFDFYFFKRSWAVFKALCAEIKD